MMPHLSPVLPCPSQVDGEYDSSRYDSVPSWAEGAERAASTLNFRKILGQRAAVAVLNVKAHLISSRKLLEAGHVNG